MRREVGRNSWGVFFFSFTECWLLTFVELLCQEILFILKRQQRFCGAEFPPIIKSYESVWNIRDVELVGGKRSRWYNLEIVGAGHLCYLLLQGILKDWRNTASNWGLGRELCVTNPTGIELNLVANVITVAVLFSDWLPQPLWDPTAMYSRRKSSRTLCIWLTHSCWVAAV